MFVQLYYAATTTDHYNDNDNDNDNSNLSTSGPDKLDWWPANMTRLLVGQRGQQVRLVGPNSDMQTFARRSPLLSIWPLMIFCRPNTIQAHEDDDDDDDGNNHHIGS